MAESIRYLLLGGGLASVWAAQTIRDHDAEGSILIVGMEKHPPYDRPPLSKESLVNDAFQPDDAYSKADGFYAEKGIQLRTGVRALSIDRAARAVALDNGETLHYEKLLIATGSTPRSLNVPGADLGGVYCLRTIEQSEAIRIAFQHSRRAVIVGAGYMGMEVASGALVRGLETTIVEHHSQPWARFASPTLGAFMQRYYESKGARFLFGETVTAIEGQGAVSAVRTQAGQRLEADVVVTAVGVTLNVDLPREAGLEMEGNDGVRVDEHLRTSDPAIWAAGDIASFNDVALGKRWRAEHFQNAKWQGRAVGAIMAGGEKPYDQVPYFYSDFLDLHMALRGDPAAGKQTRVLGSTDEAEFVELYPGDDGTLRMGIGISHVEKQLDPISDGLEKLIRAKARVADLTPDQVGLGATAPA